MGSIVLLTAAKELLSAAILSALKPMPRQSLFRPFGDRYLCACYARRLYIAVI